MLLLPSWLLRVAPWTLLALLAVMFYRTVLSEVGLKKDVARRCWNETSPRRPELLCARCSAHPVQTWLYRTVHSNKSLVRLRPKGTSERGGDEWLRYLLSWGSLLLEGRMKRYLVNKLDLQLHLCARPALGHHQGGMGITQWYCTHDCCHLSQDTSCFSFTGKKLQWCGHDPRNN